MARSGTSLVKGVFDGVTGVAMKPIEGAKEEGVGGFFKGMHFLNLDYRVQSIYFLVSSTICESLLYILLITGFGKGMVGLVARPTGGIVDSASGIMDAAKRVTEVTVEIHR